MTISPRIAYDARLAIEPYRGMGRYLRTLIAGRENNLLGLCATGEQSPTLRLKSGGFTFYPLWEQVSLPRRIAECRADTFIAPYNTAPLFLSRKVTLILIVHDLIYLDPLPRSTSLYQNVGRAYRRIIVPRAIPGAKAILTVSHYTKEQLVSQLNVDPGKITVIPCSLDGDWFCDGSPPNRESRYILMVAGEAPSKNLTRGIQAFAQFIKNTGDRQITLKVAGVRKEFHSAFSSIGESLGIGGQVQLLGYLPDHQIKSLYRNADLFVMPSLAEGFGIPVLEAMASGTPVASSSAASLPEIAGNAARYFDPASVTEMALTLQEILSNETLRTAMVAEGKHQALKFHDDQVKNLISDFWRTLEEGEER